MSPYSGFAVALLESLLIAGMSASPRGARLAFAFAVLMLPYPAFVDGSPLVRSVLALGAFWGVVRSADFALEPAPTRFGARFVHLWAIIDTRLVASSSHAVDRRWVATFFVAAAVAIAALLAVYAADGSTGALRYPARWFAGAIVMIAVFEMLTAFMRIATTLLGFRAPALSDTPHHSRSVAEFWSARWNLVVGKILRDRVFKPLSRRGTTLAIWATFAASAALHAYVIAIAVGGAEALSMAAFFLVQPLLLDAERRLRVRRWPSTARRAWTIGVLALLSPLFIEPILRVM